jgi:hypothetical protein
VKDLSRRLFFVPGGPIHRFFDVADARFGSYLSRDSHGFRLKLTTFPATVSPAEPDQNHVLAFSFNFHFDVSQTDPVDSIIKMLGRWNDAVAESTQIVEAAQE